MLEHGEVDIVDRLLPEEYEYLIGKEGIRVVSTQSTGVYQLIMNCQMKPFDDIRVRKAMNYACPQERIISEVFRGNAEPMRSPCSPLQPGFTGQYWPYEFNPDKGMALLAEAGYKKGFDIDLAYTDNSPAEELTCRLLQDVLKTLNIRVKLQKLTVTEFNRKLYRKEHCLASKFTFTVVRDPAYWGLWYKSGTFLNYQDLRDTELDDLLTLQSRILDPVERAEFSKKVQQRILELAPMVFIAYPLLTNALRDDIGGRYHVNPDSLSLYWSKLDKD
jgi:peptide/nickel transport system substrate-binding protein